MNIIECQRYPVLRSIPYYPKTPIPEYSNFSSTTVLTQEKTLTHRRRFEYTNNYLKLRNVDIPTLGVKEGRE